MRQVRICRCADAQTKVEVDRLQKREQRVALTGGEVQWDRRRTTRCCLPPHGDAAYPSGVTRCRYWAFTGADSAKRISLACESGMYCVTYVCTGRYFLGTDIKNTNHRNHLKLFSALFHLRDVVAVSQIFSFQRNIYFSISRSHSGRLTRCCQIIHFS